MAKQTFHNFSPAPQGKTLHHLPVSARGLAESCDRRKIKIWCAVCNSIRRIESCLKVLKELDEKNVYLVRLECLHERNLEVAISRTPSGKKKLLEERERAEQARQNSLSTETGGL